MQKLNHSLFLLSMTSLLAVPLLTNQAVADAGYACQVLHTFGDGNTPNDGSPSINSLTKGPDGNFYGVTFLGGSNGDGTVFKVTPGGAYTILHNFSDNNGDGKNPYGGLVTDKDGNLYGTTRLGGVQPSGQAVAEGTVYKIAPDGSNFTILHTFIHSNDFAGDVPQAGMIFGSDGNLYGTCHDDGPMHDGTVFKIAPDGSGYTDIHGFGFSGGAPLASVTQGSDGTIYGATSEGGSGGNGVMFKLNTDGSGYTILHNFGIVTHDGSTPVSPPVIGSDGNLYGSTSVGGSANAGIIYRVAPDGSGYTIVHNFNDGNTQSDGANADTKLNIAPDGSMYGATSGGGTAGQGTIFRLTTAGSYSVIYSLIGADGTQPGNDLFLDTDGKLYGIANSGGTASHGTIFRVFQPTLAVSAPAAATAGTPFNVTVTASDGTNDGLFTDYTGTLHFTSTDPTATLPADTLITNGAGSAPITLYAAATKTIRARDIANDAVTGTVNVPVNAAAFDHFALTAPTTATAGTTFYTTLSALDAYNNVVKNFTDTIHLSSTDTAAVLPANFVLTGGAKQIIIKLQMPGTQTITATDTNNSVAVTSGNINVGTVATKYLITGPATSTVGAVNTYTITAKDNVGNTATGYTGTVHFTTTDPNATVPGDITLTNGVATFQITFNTKGAQKVNANDTVSTAVKGLAATTVK